MKRFARLALVSPLFLSLLACSVSSSAPSPASTSDESEDVAAAASPVTATSGPAYAYFFVDDTRDGYVARPVNGTRAACGATFTDRCRIADVDLTALGVSAHDARDIKDAIGSERAPNAIVFVGSIASSHGRRTLQVVEAWRAPEAVRWGGTIYQVSRSGLACDEGACTAATAVRVNAWRKLDVPDVDFSESPAMAHCRFVPLSAEGCKAPYEAAQAAVATPAGLLVAGYRDWTGALVAEQYFVRVGVGDVCADGGFNYCGANTACDATAGVCPHTCTTTVCPHGRGRGVFPYERSIELQEWFASVLSYTPIVAH